MKLLPQAKAVKDTNLKANHNDKWNGNVTLSAVKDTNLKANHNPISVR